MLNAKLIAMSDMDEYEVTLEIQGITLLCFAAICPYMIEIGSFYPIELSLKVDEKLEPNVLDKEKYGLEKIGKGYEYLLQGKLSSNKLNLGVFFIRDEYLDQFPLLDGKFIELKVQGLWVTFLSQLN